MSGARATRRPAVDRGRAAVAGTVVAVLVLSGASHASAAGIVTHAWMAETAIGRTTDAGLQALLRAHADQVRAGAEFPDGGYLALRQNAPGGNYGEEAHWQRFVDAYAARIRDRTDCGDLTDPAGRCAAEVAHLFGVAAHGMGDEVWDWLFEPNAPDHGEQFIPPELASVIGPGGIELQMDVIAIVDHGRPTGPTPPLPDEADVVAAYAAVGRADVTAEGIAAGESALDTSRTLEATVGPRYADGIRAAMPWTSSHIVTADGGVEFAGRAIAAYWGDLWLRLQDRTGPTTVGATAPADGATEVPYVDWVRDYRPGSSADGGGASTRIVAYLSYGLPYEPSGSAIPPVPDPAADAAASALPSSAMRLSERDSGAPVTPMAGYPRIVPYDPTYGEHGVAFEPAGDLLRCTWYRVDVTADVKDAAGRPVTPASWTFRTTCTEPAAASTASPTLTG